MAETIRSGCRSRSASLKASCSRWSTPSGERNNKSAGSVHACEMLEITLDEPKMLVFEEDLGHHNAINNMAGWLNANEPCPHTPHCVWCAAPCRPPLAGGLECLSIPAQAALESQASAPRGRCACRQAMPELRPCRVKKMVHQQLACPSVLAQKIWLFTPLAASPVKWSSNLQMSVTVVVPRSSITNGTPSNSNGRALRFQAQTRPSPANWRCQLQAHAHHC